MNKIKYVKLEQPDGSYSDSIPLAVDSDYVDVKGSTLTNELNNKATKAEVQALASGSPKGVYATTTALINANPDTGVYIVTADGHIYSWTKNDIAAIDLGVYQATEIGNNEIKTYKTNFIRKYYSNLIKDLEYINYKFWMFNFTNNTKNQQNAGGSYVINTVPLRLEAGHKYYFYNINYITKIWGNNPDNPIYYSALENIATGEYSPFYPGITTGLILDENTTKESYFFIPSEDYNLWFTSTVGISNISQVDTFLRVEEIYLNDMAFNANKTPILDINRKAEADFNIKEYIYNADNIIPKNINLITGYYRNRLNGEIGSNENYSFIDYIPVEGGKNIVASTTYKQYSIFSIIEFDEHHNYIKSMRTDYPIYYGWTGILDPVTKYISISAETIAFPYLKINYGTKSIESNSYEQELTNFSFRDNSIKPEKTTFITKLKNYINLNNGLENYYWFKNPDTQIAKTQALISGAGCWGLFPIILKPNTIYTCSSNIFWNEGARYSYLVSKEEDDISQDEYKITNFFNPIDMTLTTDNNHYILLATLNHNLTNPMLIEGNNIPETYLDPEDESRLVIPKLWIPEKKAYPEFKIELPKIIYLLENDLFSIYYENIIKYSRLFKQGPYSMRVYMSVNGNKGSIRFHSNGYIRSIGRYKLNILPNKNNVPDNSQLIFEIVDDYSNIVITSKTVTLKYVNTNNLESKLNVVTIGDSFTDDFKVSGKQYELFNEKIGDYINMIGTRNTSNPNAKDDAISGWSYNSYWNDSSSSNMFYDSSVGHFNFNYYLTQYYPNVNVDVVVLYLGVNDIEGSDYAYTYPIKNIDQGTIQTAKNMVNNIKASSPNTKVLIKLLIPQAGSQDDWADYYGRFAEKVKWNQERWNEDLLTVFDTDEYFNQGVYVMPTNAHWDPRYSIRVDTTSKNNIGEASTIGTLVVSKFYSGGTNLPSNIPEEDITIDVHPNEIGAAYLADVGKTYVLLGRNS